MYSLNNQVMFPFVPSSGTWFTTICTGKHSYYWRFHWTVFDTHRHHVRAFLSPKKFVVAEMRIFLLEMSEMHKNCWFPLISVSILGIGDCWLQAKPINFNQMCPFRLEMHDRKTYYWYFSIYYICDVTLLKNFLWQPLQSLIWDQHTTISGAIDSWHNLFSTDCNLPVDGQLSMN